MQRLYSSSSSIPVVYDTSVKQQSHVQQPQFYPLSNCSSSSSTNYYDSDNTLRRKSSHNKATPSRLPSYSSTKNTRPALIGHAQPSRKCVSNHVTPISSPVVPAKSAGPINNARNRYSNHSKTGKSIKKPVTNNKTVANTTKDDNNNQFSQEIIDSSAQLIRDIDSTLTQLSEQYNSATNGESSEPSSLVTTPTSLANNNIAEAQINKAAVPSNTNNNPNSRSMLNKFKLKQQQQQQHPANSSGKQHTPSVTSPSRLATKSGSGPNKKSSGNPNSYTEAWLYNTSRVPGPPVSQSSGASGQPTSMMMQYMASQSKGKHTKAYNNPNYQSSSSSGSELQMNPPANSTATPANKTIEDSSSSTLTHSSRSGSKLPTTNSSSQSVGTGLKFPQKYYVTNNNNSSNSNPSTLLMLHKKSPHPGDRDSGISSKDSSLSSSEHSNSGPGNASSGKNSLPRPPPRVSSLPRQQNSTSSTSSGANTKSVSKADRRRARELFASVKQRENAAANSAHKSSTSTLNSSNADAQSEDDVSSNGDKMKTADTEIHQEITNNSLMPNAPQHGTQITAEASQMKELSVATSPTTTGPPPPSEGGSGKKLEESYAEKMQQRFREGMLAVQESLQMTAAASPTSSIGKSEVVEMKPGAKKGREELCSSSSEEIEEYLRELSGRMSSYSSTTTSKPKTTAGTVTTTTGSSPTTPGENERSTTTGRMMRERMEKYVQEKYSDEFDITSSCSMDLLLSGVNNPSKSITSNSGSNSGGPASSNTKPRKQEIMIEGAGPAPATMEHTSTMLGHETMRGRASSLSSRVGGSQIRAMSLPGPHAQQMPVVMLPPQQQALHDIDYADSLSLPLGSRPRTSSVSHSTYGPLSVRTVGGGGLDLTSSGVMSLPHHYNPNNRPRTALSRPLQGSNHQNYVYGHLQQSSNSITNANGGSYSTLANLKLPYSTNGSGVRPSTSSTSLGDSSSSYYGHVPSSMGTTTNNEHYMTHNHNNNPTNTSNHHQNNGTTVHNSNNNNNHTTSMYGSEDVYDGLGSRLSLLSTSSYRSLNEERQISEIRRLRRELEIAQQKVKSLSGQLSSNGNLVSAFESSLQSMSMRLHKFAATTESKENELNELKSTIQELKRQASVPSQHSNTTPRPSSSCSNTFIAGHNYPGNSMSPPKLYAASSLTSLSSSHHHHHHSHSLSQTKQHSSHNTGSLKKTSWLKNSLGKAFRKKSSSSNKDEGSTESINEMHSRKQPSMKSMLESESMQALRKELEEKDARLTDVQLDALSRSHQLEQLRDLLTKMRYEMSSLKADNSRLQSLMMMMSSSSSSAASGNNTVATNSATGAPITNMEAATSGGDCSPSKTGPKAKFDLINGLLHAADGSVAIVVYVSTRPSNNDCVSSDAEQPPLPLAQLLTQDNGYWLPIGRVGISSQSGWSDLDNQLKRLLKEFLASIDPASALGLTGDAMYRYRINTESWVSVCGTSGGMRPLTSPCASLKTNMISKSTNNYIQIQLKSHHYGNSIDDLVFHTLIPKQILQRYLGLLLEHRRVIICGPHGTGKSYLARQLALNLANRNTSPDSANNHNSIFTVTLEHQRSSRDLRAYLSALTEQLTRCTTPGTGSLDNGSTCSLGLSLPSTLPLVIVLENLHFVSSFTDVFSAFLALHNSNKSPYVIGTMNSSANNSYTSNSTNLWGNNPTGSGSNGTGITSNLDVHHNFRWILLANHMEPVKGLLSRCLRKRMLLQQWTQLSEVPSNHRECHDEDGSSSSLSSSTWESLVHITDWLCIVWQHVNRFIESHGGSAGVTMGPRLFLECPMDLERARGWFLDLWNFSIVPYLIEAVREGLRGHGRRQSSWEDPTDWVAKSWPWTFPGKGAGDSANLIRLRPEDVGFETYTVTTSPVQHKHPGSLTSVAMPAGSPEPISDYHKSLPLPIPHLMNQQQQLPNNGSHQQLAMNHNQMNMNHYGSQQQQQMHHQPQKHLQMTHQQQGMTHKQQQLHMNHQQQQGMAHQNTQGHPQYPYLAQQRIMTPQHPNQPMPNMGYPPY